MWKMKLFFVASILLVSFGALMIVATQFEPAEPEKIKPPPFYPQIKRTNGRIGVNCKARKWKYTVFCVPG